MEPSQVTFIANSLFINAYLKLGSVFLSFPMHQFTICHVIWMYVEHGTCSHLEKGISV